MPAEPLSDPELFAVVDEREISVAEFRRQVVSTARSRFYHFQAPQAQEEAFLREVGEDLIRRVLLAREAVRRGLVADAESVGRSLARLEERYGEEPNWEQIRDEVLPQVRAELSEASLAQQLEARIRGAITEPAEEELSAYYQANLEKFTTPAQYRLSVILLGVEPWARAEAWSEADLKAAELKFRLTEGADFATLAREYSSDGSAAAGGDMGYLHREMLSAPVQSVVDDLKVGAVAGPMRVLEGVALFRLSGKTAPEVNPLERVRARATDLWRKDAQDRAWQEFVRGLRDSARVRVNEALFARSE